MEPAKIYRSNAIGSAGTAMKKMAPAGMELLNTQKKIDNYVYNLLMQKEESVCDMATD